MTDGTPEAGGSGTGSRVEVADPATPVTTAPRPRRRILRRVLAGLGITVASLAALAALIYSFGTMASPSPEVIAAYDEAVATGQAPPVEARFHIPIPGCVCHSGDPALAMQHSTRYIRECSGCHSR